jgi:hypothetical protein
VVTPAAFSDLRVAGKEIVQEYSSGCSMVSRIQFFRYTQLGQDSSRRNEALLLLIPATPQYRIT